MCESDLPILYTFRRCPYAIRARMAVANAGIVCQLREVQLKNKPSQLVEISAKATVPVMLLPDGCILEESLDILHWALKQGDIGSWKDFTANQQSVMDGLIRQNDSTFKMDLDRYKYADRFPEFSRETYRSRAENFLVGLEKRLEKDEFLFGQSNSYADIAIFPFLRQFSKVEPSWFQAAPYPQLRVWLKLQTENALFEVVMQKYAPWSPSDPMVLFGSKN